MSALDLDFARSALKRLAALDKANPLIDRARAERALSDCRELMGLPLTQIRWMGDEGVEPLAVHYLGVYPAVVIVEGLVSLGLEDVGEHFRPFSLPELSALRSLSPTLFDNSWMAVVGSLLPFPLLSDFQYPWDALLRRGLPDTGSPHGGARGDMCAIIDRLCVALEAGAWIIFHRAGKALCVPRPRLRIEEGRLHCADGPAASWEGGPEFWFWRGVQVPRFVVEEPGSITLRAIFRVRNTEVQRVMIERYGWKRFVSDADCQTIDHDERWGTLVQIRTVWANILALIVTNRSPEPDGTFRRYVLPVEPNLRPLPDIEAGETEFGMAQLPTALNAVASTFGMRGDEYAALQAES